MQTNDESVLSPKPDTPTMAQETLHKTGHTESKSQKTGRREKGSEKSFPRHETAAAIGYSQQMWMLALDLPGQDGLDGGGPHGLLPLTAGPFTICY